MTYREGQRVLHSVKRTAKVLNVLSDGRIEIRYESDTEFGRSYELVSPDAIEPVPKPMPAIEYGDELTTKWGGIFLVASELLESLEFRRKRGEITRQRRRSSGEPGAPYQVIWEKPE